MSAAFTAEAVEFSYARSRAPAIAGVSVAIAAGIIHAIIGPNGSGKSTLLRLLLGALNPTAGRVTFAGRETGSWPRRELARHIGVVTQAEEIPFPITVHELVAMGRYPHLGPWRSAGAADRAAIARAMERCEVTHLADRLMSTLSGGERQRARLARALAQEPGTLVLDEPTAALDIAHEMTIFELLARLAATDGTTVVIVTHQLNLAARYADRLSLLDAGRLVVDGPPADVLDRVTIERVYGWPVRIVAYPGPGPDTGAPQVAPLARSGAPAGPGVGRDSPTRPATRPDDLGTRSSGLSER